MGLCCTMCNGSLGLCGCMERRSRIFGVAAIDLMLHAMCFFAVNGDQKWPNWNGSLGGRFIFLACLDDILLLIALSTSNRSLIALWRVVRATYVVTLFISWYVIIGDIFDHRQDSPELGSYLFLGSFAILILPFYYIYYLSVVKSYQNELISQVDTSLLVAHYTDYPYAAHVITIVFMHPIIHAIK